MVFLFSYWILIWVILFLIGIISYSPKFIIIVAIPFTLYEITLLSSNRYMLYNALNIGFKLLALFLVLKTPLEIIPSIIVVSFYITYIYANNKKLEDIYGRDAIIERAKKSMLLL